MATALDWDDSLNLGHPEIDRQHQKLVALINRVRACGGADADAEVEVMRTLTAMYLYAREHFFDEEALMDRLDFAEAAAHKAMHQFFVAKTQTLTDACLGGGATPDDVGGFLVSWLREHIAVEDAKIVRLLRQDRRRPLPRLFSIFPT